MKNKNQQSEQGMSTALPFIRIEHDGLNPDPESFEQEIVVSHSFDPEDESCQLEEDLENGDVEEEEDPAKYFGLDVLRNDLDEK